MLVKKESIFLQDLLAEIIKILGNQEAHVERVLIPLLADGHVLNERLRALEETMRR
jgi:hypothetical protein